MKVFFDIETDGLLEKVSCVHSLVVAVEGGETLSLHEDLEAGLTLLRNADEVIGHNIICFDLPVLKKIFNFETKAKITDTYVLSRLYEPDLLPSDIAVGWAPKHLIGSHSLEAWGHRLGVHKTKIETDWSTWTPEMQKYCEQDVKVTQRLYNYLECKQIPEQASYIEHEFQKIIFQQEQNGVLFDIIKAKELAQQVKQDIDEREQRLRTRLPLHLKRGKHTDPKVSNSKMGTRKGSTYTKISFTEFNPASRTQIIEYLIHRYGWKPTLFTDKGNVQLSEETLRELPYEEGPLFAECFERRKVYGYLEEGTNSWLKFVKRGRIHGHVNTIGAVTGRCTHSKPNLGQVPSIRSYMGKECRELFHAGSGYMIGADASGIELRMLAHYLNYYDNGAYAREILEGDIHTKNQKAAGLPNRDSAKTFIYAFLYGAGNEKLGSIVSGTSGKEGNAATGKRFKTQLFNNTTGLFDLLQDVQRQVKKNGHLRALDRRILHIRSQHSALNTLLQGAAAIVMKLANIYFWKDAQELYFMKDCYQVLNVHDEFEVITPYEKYTDIIGRRMVDSMTKAGEELNLKIRIDGEYKIGKNWAEVH